MDYDEQFSLQWNDHQNILVGAFDALFKRGSFTDCTLAAEGKHINAHKVVLSACSPFFESLLAQTYDKHPILILNDVKFAELEAIMDYMYRGSINIYESQLASLLKAASLLQIKGLSDKGKEVNSNTPDNPRKRPRTSNNNDDEPIATSDESNEPNPRPTPPPAPIQPKQAPHQPRIKIVPKRVESPSIVRVKIEQEDTEWIPPNVQPDTEEPPHTSIYQLPGSFYEDEEEFEYPLTSQEENQNEFNVDTTKSWNLIGDFKCLNCEKSYKYKTSLYRHTKFECGKEPCYDCPFCDHKAKQKVAMEKHVINRHNAVIPGNKFMKEKFVKQIINKTY